MAKFCSQCGRPLKEGEVCDCKKEGAASGAEQRQPEQEDAFRQSQWDNSYRREKQSSVYAASGFHSRHAATASG